MNLRLHWTALQMWQPHRRARVTQLQMVRSFTLELALRQLDPHAW
jgi:hypothetical protein